MRLTGERLSAGLLQLTMLERRTARGGKDSIDHPRGGHDDVANSVAGSLVCAFKEPGVYISDDDEERYRPARGPDHWLGT